MPRMIVDLYTPGMGAEPDRNAIAADPEDLYVKVVCWGGCEAGIYVGPAPDEGSYCVECRGTGARFVPIL